MAKRNNQQPDQQPYQQMPPQYVVQQMPPQYVILQPQKPSLLARIIRLLFGVGLVLAVLAACGVLSSLILGNNTTPATLFGNNNITNPRDYNCTLTTNPGVTITLMRSWLANEQEPAGQFSGTADIVDAYNTGIVIWYQLSDGRWFRYGSNWQSVTMSSGCDDLVRARGMSIPGS